MISCTEFIPSYSELFTYLEDHHGRDEVERFWKYLFTPNGKNSPLSAFVEKEGIRGCFDYWKGTLNEEAADFTMYLNEKASWFFNDMHHCPSKGRLLELKDALGITPYHDYCLHCDNYRQSVAKGGLKYIYNFIGTDHASCSMLIYDPKKFDGRVIPDENTVIMDRRASDNEYFHRGFHNSMNMGIEYLGTHFGEGEVKAYLVQFTEHVYRSLMEDMKKRGLVALKEKIEDTYAKEHAGADLATNLEGNEKLTVSVRKCPAVTFLKEAGYPVTQWFEDTTTVVMDTLAKETGYAFTMDSYDPETGAARYHFIKN